jgi:hypothetical protein
MIRSYLTELARFAGIVAAVALLVSIVERIAA